MSYNMPLVNEAVHKALRVASALSYGSLILPYESSTQWPQIRAWRAAQLKQWVIERENFERDVVSGYQQMGDGAVRQLVAGTGVGKSTRLPYLLASSLQISGLVLMPNNLLTAYGIPYLKRMFSEWGAAVKVSVLRSSHVDTTETGPCVYYSSAVDFLARWAVNPGLLDALGIDFIYMDESHVARPDYEFFKYLQGAGRMGSIRIFYGTATAAGDIDMERGGPSRSLVARPSSQFALHTPEASPRNSPMHYTQVTDRTMVFLATDQLIDEWYRYYDTHDIPAFKYGMTSSSRDLMDIQPFLDRNVLCVLLVTSSFQTGFTFNVDTVVCTGQVLEACTDFAKHQVSLRVRNVTKAERVQRMGRVGRFKPGRGFYVDVECHQEEPVGYESAFCIFLWSIVFNVQINETSISSFASLTGESFTRKAAAMLLHSRIPPLLLLPYVGNDGFYKGWAGTMRFALYTHVNLGSVDDNSGKVQSWPSYSTGPVAYAQSPITYKSAAQFPKEWSVLPAIAWVDYQGIVALPVNIDSSRSVISVVSTQRVRRAHSRTVSAPSIATHGVARSSVASTQDIRDVAGSSAVSIQNPPPYASRDSIATRASISHVRIPTIREVQREYPMVTPTRLSHISEVATVQQLTPPTSPGVDRVSSWREAVASDARFNRNAGSDSSSDREALQLKRINPAKYPYCKFYPAADDLCKVFLADSAVTPRDEMRVKNLLTGSSDFSTMVDDMGSTRQRDYFLAVIRVHNSCVMKRMQITSSKASRGMISKLFTVDAKALADRVNETCALLRACALESYFVAIDKRAQHASFTQMLTPDFEQHEVTARVSLSFGVEKVKDVVEYIFSLSVPHIVDGYCVANAWRFGNCILSVAHPYDGQDDTVVLHADASGVEYEDAVNDILLFKSKDSVGYAQPFIRDIHDGEFVYVVKHDVVREAPTIIGVFRVTGDSSFVFMDFHLAHGDSGALVVAVTDGAVLGLYIGPYSPDETRIAPASAVAKHLAK